MEQIRARIREKRGVDYTEQQIRELAAVKLEKFLDPRGVRSDLLDRVPKGAARVRAARAAELRVRRRDALRIAPRRRFGGIRKLLLPLLKLFFNPNPLIQALHIQSRLNTMNAEREARRESARRAIDQLYYELIHNLVVETTRLGIEVKNLKMRVESLTSRLEFNERRARALESVVVYKPAEPDERPSSGAGPAQHRAAPQPSHAPSLMRAGAQRASAGAAGMPPPPAGAGRSQRQEPGAPGPGAPRRSRSAQPPTAPAARPPRRRLGRGDHGRAGTTLDASALTDSTEQMDAMDRMDDDGSPESEEAHAVAAETVDQALGAGRTLRPVVESSAARPSPEPGRAALDRPRIADEPTADPAETPASGRARRLRQAPTRRAVKLAVVVQRYGQAINGGAELHARYIAEHLARHAEVEVLTTCATRLRHVAERAAARRRAGQRRSGPPLPREARARSAGLRPALGSRLRAAAFARRRARLARRRGTDEPGARRLHRQARRPTTTTACSSAIATTTRITARAPRRSRAILVPTAERDAAIGLSIFQPIFRGVRALMYNSPEERAMIQAVSGNHDVPGRRRRRRIGRPAQPAAGAVPAEVQHPRAVCRLRRPHRREQGLQGAVRVLPGLSARSVGQAVARPDRQLAAADSRASAHPASRLPRRRRQVRRDGGRRSADHAVVLREPVDGRARSVGARPAGAGQRQVRRAEGPVHPQQRRPLLRDATREFVGDAARASSRTAGWRHARAATAGSSSASTTTGRSSSGSISTCSSGSKEHEPPRARRMEPLPGWFARRRRRTCRRPQDVLGAAAAWRRLTRRSGARGGREAVVIRIHQVLATLGYGDAIGHEVLGIQRVLRAAGYESEIFVETADHRLEPLTRDYRELVDASHPDNLLLHHFSLGSKASRTAFALPDRMALIYHNITPPEYFVGVHRTLARQCFRGRRELQRLRRSLRSGARRLGVQPAGSRGARLPADRRAAGRARLLASRRRAEPASSPISSTTTGPTSCSSAG